ncbi:MAG: FMN-binding protein [Actinobacteria bacterium]|nr:FMN-binding protein [Actinomycetota bacterium]
MATPNLAKRILLGVVGTAAGAAGVMSTMSSAAVQSPLAVGGTDMAGGVIGGGQFGAQATTTTAAKTTAAKTTAAKTTAAKPAGVTHKKKHATRSTTHASTRPTKVATKPAASKTPSPAQPASVNGTFTGNAARDGGWGSITVTITVKNNKIVNSTMRANVFDQQSQFINTQMQDWNSGLTVPSALKQQTLQAQSARISGVSGATYTSYAYAQSLQSAISQAKL